MSAVLSKDKKREKVQILGDRGGPPTVLEIGHYYKAQWNKFVSYAKQTEGSKLLSWNVMPDSVCKLVAKRHMEPKFDFLKICDLILASKWLLGLTENPKEGPGSNWQGATFDWIFYTPEHYMKILSGKYTDYGRGGKRYVPLQDGGGEFEHLDNEMADIITAKLMSLAS